LSKSQLSLPLGTPQTHEGHKKPLSLDLIIIIISLSGM